MKKTAISLLTASVLTILPVAAYAQPDGPASSSDALIKELSTDILPLASCEDRFQPVQFDPSVHEYCAYAYYHTDTVSVRAVGVPGAVIEMNGKGADANGRGPDINVSNGADISVSASLNGVSDEYRITVKKLQTDYRGNEKISADVDVNGLKSADEGALVDGNLTTGVTLKDIKRAPRKMWITDNPSQATTGFVLTLDQPRWVHRVNAWASIDQWAGQLAAGQPKHWWEADALNIAVRASDDEPFTVIAKHATMRQDAGGLLYWDFGEYKKVKEIHIWFNNQKDGAEFGPMQGSQYTFNELEVWGLPSGQRPKDETETADFESRYTDFDPASVAETWGVNRAQALAMQYGILLPAWMPSDGYGRGTVNGEEINKAGGLFPAFYDNTNLGPNEFLEPYMKGDSVEDQGIFNATLMDNLGKGTPWAVAKAPIAGNNITSAGEPHDFLSTAAKDHADSLVDIQYGDEGNWSKEEQDNFEKWFDWSKRNYPGAVVHSNQASNEGWYNYDTLSSYVKQTKPDLISWDRYYFSTAGSWGVNYQPEDPADVIPHILSAQNPPAKMDMATQFRNYRQVASEGLTGDGSQPIMWGQYLDYSFDANVSDSQKSVIPMVSLAAGAKWLGLFRMEMNGYDYSTLFDADGAPRREFYEWARVLKDVRGYGNYLAALNNQFLTVKPGQYDKRAGTGVEEGYKLADFGSEAERKVAAKYGVEDVKANNRGGLNSGKSGDVVLGYFDAVPGLTAAKRDRVFGESTDPVRAVMVVNGLVGSTDTSETKAISGGQWVDKTLSPLARRTDNGGFTQTSQDIKVTVKQPYENAQLMLVDPETFEAKPLDVVYGEDGVGDVTLTNVGGGQARLLYWVSGVEKVVNPEEGSPSAVTPIEPVWDDQTGSFTVPAVEGVTYEYDGEEVSVGEVVKNLAGKTVNVTAKPTSDLFVLAQGAKVSFVHTFPPAKRHDAPGNVNQKNRSYAVKPSRSWPVAMPNTGSEASFAIDGVAG